MRKALRGGFSMACIVNSSFDLNNVCGRNDVEVRIHRHLIERSYEDLAL